MAAPAHGIAPPSWQTQVKAAVGRRYAQQAKAWAFAPGGAERARKAGYPQDWLERLPHGLAEAYLGCGFALEEVDLAGVRVVVDLGCGAGLDARLIAEALGPDGMVLALDLAPAMVERARRVVGAVGAVGAPAASTLRFMAGDMEQLPIAAGTVDLVLANGSFNLTVDKETAFSEARRVLRPGGRLIARDLVREGELPAEIAQDPIAWNASLGGVLEQDDLSTALRGAGFDQVRISHHRPFPPVVAVRVEALKPRESPPKVVI
jgi:SAM-dependent methyltransferase